VSYPIIILPDYYAQRIIKCRKDFGMLLTRPARAEGVFLVDGFTKGRNDGRQLGGSEVASAHFASAASAEHGAAWYRAEPGLHFFGDNAARRGAALRLEEFRSGLHGRWIGLTHGADQLCVTYTETGEGGHDWCAWILSEDNQSATAIDIQLIAESLDLLEPLREHWPLGELAHAHVMALGAGSIGSHVNDALCSYGLRRLTLVDPDRLLAHNFARHRAHHSQLGRLKVNAERDRLLGRDSGLTVQTLALDVVYDADVLRALLADVDLVVVTTDGVNPRRSANHLARLAATPAVFACVLENGAYGEILRVRPGAGCLLCARAVLREHGGIVPEATLDRGYGTGSRHQPMTAVPGDLALVGALAGKVSVATLLEPLGYRDQHLPGDHAILGLRPLPGKPEPFDVEQAGLVKWRRLPEPRADCPSCHP